MKVAIIGRSEILYEAAELLLKENYKIPLIISSREAPEYTKKAKDFENLAKRIKADYYYISRIDGKKIKEKIKKSNCEIALSMNYSNIISQEIIELFPLGILNAHAGDLPRYKGNACQAWAILNGEKKIAVCIHAMIGGEIDSGSIIDRKYLRINHNTKVTECWEWLRKKIPTMFLISSKKLKKNPNYFLQKQSKKPKDSLRCYPRVPKDGKIDWNKSNIDVLRLINCSNKPYSGAYTFFNKKKLIIWDAEIIDDSENYLSEVGQVANIEKDGGVIVITGKGKLKIKKVEYNRIVCKPKKIIKSIRNRLC